MFTMSEQNLLFLGTRESRNETVGAEPVCSTPVTDAGKGSITVEGPLLKFIDNY